MKHIIKVGHMEIEKGLCTVAFNLHSQIGEQAVTHNFLYDLLNHEATKDVKVVHETKATFTHGAIKFRLYSRGVN